MVRFEFWIWLTFFSLIILLLAFDLGLLNRNQHEIKIKRSLALSIFYFSAGCLFGSGVWWLMGKKAGLDYFSGFLIEKTLSLDNIFVISLIFNALKIPSAYQHRVLFWGVLGAIVMRAIMIATGLALVQHFHWILYLFGIFLLITGIKMLLNKGEQTDMRQSPILKYLKAHIRTTATLHNAHFFVRRPDEKNKYRWFATPLFLALLMVEIADIVFAVDSIPAVFAITQDPLIIYTSNIFAILGLRALYFVLLAMLYRFKYLKYALAIVLIFVGIKICSANLWPISSAISLAIMGSALLGGIGYSLYKTRRS